MPAFGGRACIGAYVCPAGVFAIECRRTSAGLEVERSFDVPARLETVADAADHLVRVLTSAEIERAEVAIALRGFGVVHHVMQLPAAAAEILSPIIDRELRRLEPQLVDSVIAWTPLAASAHAAAAEARAAQLVGAVPKETVHAFESRLSQTLFTLSHVTALPAAMVRIAEEFDRSDDVSGLVAALPDGAFLGFFLAGALRLVVEPPPHPAPDSRYDATALAEEAELGAMFMRQQFHGASVDRITIVGAVDAVDDAESALSGRLGIPAKRLAVRDLSAAAHAAIGAVLDSTSVAPLSFGGAARVRDKVRVARRLQTVFVAACVLALVLAAWTTLGAIQTRRASAALAVARKRIQQDSFGLAGVRSTAAQRKLMRDALAALRFVADDRSDLQKTIVNIASAMSPGIRVDSIALGRSADGWSVVIGGAAPGETSAHAVQTLHDFYQELPRRLAINDLSLRRLSYDNAESANGAVVRFELSFAAPTERRP